MYFIYTLTFKKIRYNHIESFKINLSCFDSNARCLLSVTEKDKYSFVCSNCKIFNFVNFDIIVNKYTIEYLRKHAGISK